MWSDLHLGHKASVTAFDRPFRTLYEMDQAMMDAWYELVGADDTTICLGDVSVDGSVQDHHQRWWRGGARRQVARAREPRPPLLSVTFRNRPSCA